MKAILILGLGGIFIGNILGRILYGRYQNHRKVFVTSGSLFVTLAFLYLLRDLAVPAGKDPVVVIFFFSRLLFPALIAGASIMFGITLNYSMRVSCNEFIDSDRGIERFVGFMLVGVPIGMLMSTVRFSAGLPAYLTAPVALFLIPSLVLLKLPCNPAPLYAREDEEEREDSQTSTRPAASGGVMSCYLNFLYVILYAFLGTIAIDRYFGDTMMVNMTFMVLVSVMMSAGFGVGSLLRAVKLQVYGQSFLPVAFLVFLALLMSAGGRLHFAGGVLLLAPAAILMGAILNHTVNDVIARLEHDRRATILEFSILILPVPVMIALSFITFTNFWFLAVLCLLMLANVVVPAVLMVSNPVPGYRKILYFVFSLVFFPLFLFILLYYRIPVDSGIYAARTGNFEELKNVNYDADYIPNRGTVTMGGLPVFSINDSVIRNLKRALVPVALHHRGDGGILFIDGNHRFFRNPVIGSFPRATCLDILSDRDVDYQRVPVSGTQKYVSDSDDILNYLSQRTVRYASIVDIPNLLDQDQNAFRFSAPYYRLIKSYLNEGGLFAQVLSVPGCRPEIFMEALKNARGCFKRQAVYFFSNVFLVICSDGDGAFEINQDRYGGFIGFMNAHEGMNAIFLNETHVVSHLAAIGVREIMPLAHGGAYVPALLFVEPARLRMAPRFYESWTDGNVRVLDILDRRYEELPFRQSVINELQTGNAMLTLLKKTELAEARERYREETALLFELKKQSEFRIPLQEYVLRMLRYKEKYYYAAAVRMERARKWDDARELYLAVRVINADNFEANYRLGLLSITLQDIEGAFTYLQEAMRINGNHPKVLLQMGILNFSSGKYDKAVEFFNRALQQKEPVPAVYRYLGLSHEELGNLYDAERFYVRAIEADPSDIDTKSRLNAVRARIQKESRKWDAPERRNEAEAEQDADMPLPVSKGAYEIRLKDDDTSLPVLDPVTGEEIQTEGEQTGGNKPDMGKQTPQGTPQGDRTENK